VSRRAWLWVAFAAVHLMVAWLGFTMSKMPMGDVYLVYEPWARDAVAGNGIVGIDSDWVYPQLALLPMLVAQGLAWIAGYEVAWALMITALDAIAFAMMLGRGRSAGRTAGAAFWLAYLALLGPIGMYRIDAVTVPLAVAGCLWLVGRPLVASLILAVATWIKVWPAALIAAAVIAVRRRLTIIGGALVVTAVTAWTVVAMGGGAHVFGFVSGQTARGLQLEAPVSTFYLWRAVAGIQGSFIYYDRDLLTFQVAGPAVDVVIAVMTPLLFLVVAGIAATGAFKAWRGAGFAALFPPLALSLVLALIVFNKVGSPQFLSWLIAPIVLGLVLDRRRWWPVAGAALAAALLTQLVYPVMYSQLLSAGFLAAAVLTARNLVMIVLLGWAISRLVRVPQRARHPVTNRSH
jgi:hypothetical protein